MDVNYGNYDYNLRLLCYQHFVRAKLCYSELLDLFVITDEVEIHHRIVSPTLVGSYRVMCTRQLW